jgi:hypothetical protein
VPREMGQPCQPHNSGNLARSWFLGAY